MAIPVGTDRTLFDRQLKKRKAERDAVSGGWRFTIFDEMQIVIQPGLLTYDERRHIRKITGESVEGLGQEMGGGRVGMDTMTAVIWVGLYQQLGEDAPDIEEVAELVSTMNADDMGEVEIFDADGETVDLEADVLERTADAAAEGGVDITDPLSSGSNSMNSGLHLPDLESGPTTSVS